MKFKAALVTCFLIAKVVFVLGEENVESKASDVKKLEDLKLIDADFSSDEKTHEAQRRRDPGYYYSTPSRFTSGNRHGFRRHRYRGRIVTRLQNQINRPFKHYGPPNQDNAPNNFESNQPTSTDGVVNQEIPSPIRDSDFVEESPIASQNTQPFGQHTANYLPPKNQKLPSNFPAHLFSNQNHDFPEHHHQQQQQQFQSQQDQQQQQQQFQSQQDQQQFQQLQADNQNFLGQDFNSNFGQNEFTNQQISDAALFLSQNAQAISDLYGAPAPNENYAPHSQEFEQIDQHQQQTHQNLNVQVGNNGQTQIFQPSQLPSYASGVLNSQAALEKIQSLEKDRIISQLQQTLTNREAAARYAQYVNSNNNRPNENLLSLSSQQPSSSFIPSTTIGYQGYYTPSPPVTTTTQAPVPTSTATSTTTLHPSQGSSGAGSTQVGTSLPAPHHFNPPVLSPAFQTYGGFVPTYVQTPTFIPSVPTYGTTFISTTPLKPAENSPTHFGLPIPTLEGPKPAHPPATLAPAPPKPPAHPGTPTITIPLGPVHPPHQPTQPVPPPRPIFAPVQPAVVRPNPVPIIPAATPVHPTYGLHPGVVNPGLVYKPVKVYPVYYYPGSASYQSIHKVFGTSASSHPWSYAPSFQGKPSQIWK